MQVQLYLYSANALRHLIMPYLVFQHYATIVVRPIQYFHLWRPKQKNDDSHVYSVSINSPQSMEGLSFRICYYDYIIKYAGSNSKL